MLKVANNLITENLLIKRRILSTEVVIDEYIHWKKDTAKFKKYMEKKYERKEGSKSKDGAGTPVSDK